MRIVSWNCNGAFRKKFEKISELNADIYIIQECEDPARANHQDYLQCSKNYFWIGDSKNKGLGLFPKDDIDLKALVWPNRFKNQSVKYFLPCRVNNHFDLLGT